MIVIADVVTSPVVKSSMLLKLEAEIERSLNATASFPSPVIVDEVFAV